MAQAPRLTSKGQVTIPAVFRKKLGLKPHDRMVFEEHDGALRMRKSESVIDRLFGSVPYDGPPLDWRELRTAYEQGVADEIVGEIGKGE